MEDCEKRITLQEALHEVEELALRVGSQHLILGAALVLLVRAAPLARTVQHRLLTAGAALLEIAEMTKGDRRSKPRTSKMWEQVLRCRYPREHKRGHHHES